MDIVLEKVCAELPNGGGHESRKFIAEQLIRCARSGNALGVAEQPWVNLCTPRAALSFKEPAFGVRVLIELRAHFFIFRNQYIAAPGERGRACQVVGSS